MTHQDQFGGAWTQQKLQVLSKYLHAYTTIFKKNKRAQFYTISYVDAFAGTGVIRRPGLGGIAELIPGMAKAEEEFRKGSARRALEVKPAFDKYVFIEKNATKCNELKALAAEFPDKRTEIINEDANIALLRWCAKLNTTRERAVVFLDPFGTSMEWKVISALGKTRAVDLWVLFPYFAINRMLVRDRKPHGAWANRLTKVFGTADWEKSFYSRTAYQELPLQERAVFLFRLLHQPARSLIGKEDLDCLAQGCFGWLRLRWFVRIEICFELPRQLLRVVPVAGLRRAADLLTGQKQSANPLQTMASPPASIVAMFATFQVAGVDGQDGLLSRFANSCRA